MSNFRRCYFGFCASCDARVETRHDDVDVLTTTETTTLTVTVNPSSSPSHLILGIMSLAVVTDSVTTLQ